jgi:hypothetical protein
LVYPISQGKGENPMRTYRYKNQYSEAYRFGCLEGLALFISIIYIGSVLMYAKPIHMDAATEFLKQFEFGQYAPLAVAAEIKVAGASAILKKPETKEEIVAASRHPEEIDHIWLKETSRGTNTNPNALHNICKAQGKSNEFGYGGMQNMWCYDSFEQSVRVVDAWLDKQTAENLCYYNVGIKTSNCNYVK